MTSRDSGPAYAHDQPSPHRRLRSPSVASTRSSSARSPSPMVTFTATPISPDAKGVKNITRTVIKTLEGLGHLDSTSMAEQDDAKSGNNGVEDVLRTTMLERLADHNKVSNTPTARGQTFQHPRSSHQVAVKKIDWEIPRKVFHSSIGFLTLYLWLSNGDAQTVSLILWAALAIIAPVDVLRLNYPPFEPVFERFFGFLMRESEKSTSNGVIWYILGVNFVLMSYPLDVASVSILILSWADTAASTFGRLWGSRTPRLPARVPILGLPLAPRKSLAGFIAAATTGMLIAVGFWGWIAPLRHDGADCTWNWDGGVRAPSSPLSISSGGWIGLGVIGLFSGLVSGVAEALDLGSLDDNLTLPIISGGCILGFLKLLGLLSS